MRKMIIALLMIAVLAIPAFSIGWEVGLNATVVPGEGGREGEGGVEPVIGFHIGISPIAILYASWDALALPPNMIQGMTTFYDEANATWVQGYYRPGFLNLFNFGLRFILGPVVLYTTVGTNNIYIYKQSDLPAGAGGSWGANLRIGAGAKFGWWGVGLSGTAIFPSFATMVEVFRQLGSEENRQWALDQIVNGLVPSLTATLYF
jgi:hypothetical protein